MNFSKQHNKGSITLTVTILFFLITVAGISIYFIFFRDGNRDLVSANLEVAVSESVSKVLGEDKKDIEIEIVHREGIYATGKAFNKNNEETTYFYTVFTGGVWRMVEVANDISCERLESLGFSGYGLLGCKSQYHNAQKANEVKDKIENGEDVDLLTLIGILGQGEDPFGSVVSVSSGGSSLNVDISNSQSNAEMGDVVIITIDSVVSNSNNTGSNSGSNNGGTVIVASSVEDIADEDDEIVEELLSEDDDTPEIEDESDILEPETSSEEESNNEFNIFDLNQSDLVKLRND